MLQWAALDAGGLPGMVPVPETLAEVAAWPASGAPTVALEPGGSSPTAAVVPVGVVAGQRGGAVVTFTPDAVRRGLAASFALPALRTRAAYALRASCNGVGARMGPVVPSRPATVTPEPPLITGVTVPTGLLSTAGGSVVRVVGLQLGGLGAVVTLGLANGVYTFAGAPCVVAVSGAELSCEAPVGVGAGHAAWVVVDGVASARFLNTTVNYAPPFIASIAVEQGAGEGGGDAGTEGGAVVVITGANFGPATGLAPPALGAVTYTPPDFALRLAFPVSGRGACLRLAIPPRVCPMCVVGLAWRDVPCAYGECVCLRLQLAFPARDCVISRNHTELTCVMGPGVGGRLQWSLVVAGQVRDCLA